MVCWKCARKVAIGVSPPVSQRSLAPMRMVTYWAPCPTVAWAWPGASSIFAPDTELLWRWPRMAGFCARMRS
jgi:hypothetical protein